MNAAARRLAPLVLTLPLAAQWTPPKTEDLQHLLDDWVAHRGSSGIVVGLLDHGTPRFLAAGRSAGPDSPAPDADTEFEIGSISKVFTTTLLAEMVGRGEVALDDPVQKLLPKDVRVPARGDRQITLLDLATASSGLPRLPEMKPKNASDPYADFGAAELYAWLGKYELERDPGAKYEYSNLGMGLLGHALALRLGKGYEACVRERVLAPLGLADTAIELSAAQRARLAAPHDQDLEPSSNWTFDALAGAGAWRSTARDMLKWLAACMSPPQGKLGDAMRSTFAVRRPTTMKGMSIGLGWHVAVHGEQHTVWHNGGTGGYHSFCGFDPASGANVVVLSNSAKDIDDLGRHVLDPSFQPKLPAATKPKPKAEVAVPAAVLARYAGTYEFAPGFAIEITADGDKLFAQATGQQKVRVFASSPTRFFFRVVDAELDFATDAEGKATAVTLLQDGTEQVGKRR
jgi:D-alanyl-D-alanine-carboxypeptidase/D-alanyl-D-alanine-endopeptidase